MVDARLPDGSRTDAVLAPLALDGTLGSIRRFGARPPVRSPPEGVRAPRALDGPRVSTRRFGASPLVPYALVQREALHEEMATFALARDPSSGDNPRRSPARALVRLAARAVRRC